MITSTRSHRAGSPTASAPGDATLPGLVILPEGAAGSQTSVLPREQAAPGTLTPAPTILVDIDTQADFCDADGALAVPGADAPSVRAEMASLVASARRGGALHLATADDHQLSDPEISDSPDFRTTFPPHCLRATPGAMKVDETRQHDPFVLGDGDYSDGAVAALLARHREVLVLKQTTDAFSAPGLGRILTAAAPTRAIVFGVATDICVSAAVAGLVARGIEVWVVADACAGLDAANTEACLLRWRSEGVRLATLDEAERALQHPGARTDLL